MCYVNSDLMEIVLKSKCVFLILIIVLIVSGCQRGEPEGDVKSVIEQGVRFNNHMYYWETDDGVSSVHRIMETTSDINTILHDLQGVRDIESSDDALYILHDNVNEYIRVTRLEADRATTTEASGDYNLNPHPSDIWAVSRNNIVFNAGVDDGGSTHVIGTTFMRKEAERTFRENEVMEPTMTFTEQEWLVTQNEIGSIAVTANGDRLALTMSDGSDDGKFGLYFIDSPGESPYKINEMPVWEIAGFSMDGKYFLASFEYENAVDIFLIRLDNMTERAVTGVAYGNVAGKPVWHPNSRYFLYTLEIMEEYFSRSTPLSGEQLFLYSMDSMQERRLTAYEDKRIWVDFSPQGDFLLYATSPGVIPRSGRGISDETGEIVGVEEGLETVRMNYVEWDPEKFTSGNLGIIPPDDIRFILSWTMGGDNDINFVWGPIAD